MLSSLLGHAVPWICFYRVHSFQSLQLLIFEESNVPLCPILQISVICTPITETDQEKKSLKTLTQVTFLPGWVSLSFRDNVWHPSLRQAHHDGARLRALTRFCSVFFLLVLVSRDRIFLMNKGRK
jgi:hypothetical protein